ncbi:MAG: hypothetical protein AAGA11_19350 [Pseudomonadota bacterium]
MQQPIHESRFSRLGTVAAATVLALGLAACSDSSSPTATDDPTPGGDGSATVRGGLLVADPDFNVYYVSADDIMSGVVTAIGQGREGFDASGGLRVGDFLYTKNWDTDTIDQWAMSASGPAAEPTRSLAWSALCDGCGGYLWNVYNGDTLVMTKQFGWEVAEGATTTEAPWVMLSLPDMTVSAEGTMTVPLYGDELQAPGWPGLSAPLISGPYAYFGTTYGNEDVPYNTPDTMVTLRYDFPGFTNPTIIENPITSGDGSGWVGGMSWVDENGDIFQINLLSKGWWDYGSKHDTQDTHVMKIDGATGEYDTTYQFNLSDSFSHTISITQATYFGNGRVAVLVQNEDNYDDWDGMYTGNHGRWVLIDTVNRTVQDNLGLPTFPGGYFYGGFERDGKYYVPVVPAGENPTSYIYSIDINTGETMQGAAIDGGNLSGLQLFDHN